MSSSNYSPESPESPEFSRKWKLLDDVIADYYEANKLSEDKKNEVIAFVRKLEDWLQNDRNKRLPGARLDIIGSVLNGTGTKTSDIDLCFRFESDEPPKDVKLKSVLWKISRILAFNGIQNKIVHAKVPIVRCVPEYTPLSGLDISYYNSLPIFNTQLIAKYGEWEPKRFPQLAVLVKKWAKAVALCDSSVGWPNPYAWVITLIHYLQNCSPPVLPRLQEQFRFAETEPNLNCGWDTYFHEDVVLNWSLNTQGVAELFHGFLDYLETLDYGHLVIQIRRKEPMMKNEKEWQSYLCIEDPFDMNRNMGRYCDGNMLQAMLERVQRSKKAFVKAMENIENHPNSSLESIFFEALPSISKDEQELLASRPRSQRYPRRYGRKLDDATPLNLDDSPFFKQFLQSQKAFLKQQEQEKDTEVTKFCPPLGQDNERVPRLMGQTFPEHQKTLLEGFGDLVQALPSVGQFDIPPLTEIAPQRRQEDNGPLGFQELTGAPLFQGLIQPQNEYNQTIQQRHEQEREKTPEVSPSVAQSVERRPATRPRAHRFRRYQKTPLENNLVGRDIEQVTDLRPTSQNVPIQRPQDAPFDCGNLDDSPFFKSLIKSQNAFTQAMQQQEENGLEGPPLVHQSAKQRPKRQKFHRQQKPSTDASSDSQNLNDSPFFKNLIKSQNAFTKAMAKEAKKQEKKISLDSAEEFPPLTK